MSAATRTKLADAQKARWARAKAGMRGRSSMPAECYAIKFGNVRRR
jgi:hypothetical protein